LQFLKLEDLSVVRRDDQDFRKVDRSLDAFAIHPGLTGTQNVLHELMHLISLLRRRITAIAYFFK
jgi:hypothetical protein